MASIFPYKNLLIWLSAIFALRVVLQFTLQFTQVDFLPTFDLWHSETMPYSVLLGVQCILLASMLVGIFKVEAQRPHPKLAKFLTLLASMYLAIMLIRLIIGTLNFSQHSWFNGAVSTAFHFGLAAYLFVYAAALKSRQRNNKHRSGLPLLSTLIQTATYPCILSGSYMLFIWLLGTGSPLMFSAYLSVLIGASGILIHETLAPYKDNWRPDKKDLLNDGLFLAIVQVALPAMLKGLCLVVLVWISKNHSLPASNYWPHQVPILIQVLLMMVVAEFFRYWIHRASHTFKPLWKLHAVHHAADKLYTVNVGRFHPLDKTIQFLGDTLPFLLIGVAPEVFAAYFVVYALNGFYQHSNANVKLGALNWIIAGPELHRWHHSAVYSEANGNFGNNLIVWDLIFGTRFLPNDRQVGRRQTTKVQAWDVLNCERTISIKRNRQYGDQRQYDVESIPITPAVVTCREEHGRITT